MWVLCSGAADGILINELIPLQVHRWICKGVLRGSGGPAERASSSYLAHSYVPRAPSVYFPFHVTHTRFHPWIHGSYHFERYSWFILWFHSVLKESDIMNGCTKDGWVREMCRFEFKGSIVWIANNNFPRCYLPGEMSPPSILLHHLFTALLQISDSRYDLFTPFRFSESLSLW